MDPKTLTVDKMIARLLEIKAKRVPGEYPLVMWDEKEGVYLPITDAYWATLTPAPQSAGKFKLSDADMDSNRLIECVALFPAGTVLAV